MTDVSIYDTTSSGRHRRVGLVSIAGTYKAGDPPPSGYNDWHEWVRVQHKAGLRQKLCSKCLKWRFPQEIASETPRKSVGYKTKRDAMNGTNPIEIVTSVVVCKKCDEGP